jgi:hypothetical protein
MAQGSRAGPFVSFDIGSFRYRTVCISHRSAVYGVNATPAGHAGIRSGGSQEATMNIANIDLGICKAYASALHEETCL